MREKFKILLERPWFAYTVATCSAVVLFLLLSNLAFIGTVIDCLSPILWGILLAYLINPLMVWIETKLLKKMKREKPRHLIAVILSILLILILIVVLVATLIPSIAESVTGIIDNMDSYGATLQKYLKDISAVATRMNIDLSQVTKAGEEMIQTMVSYVTDNANTIATTFFSVGTSIANIAIGIVLAIYFLLDKKNLVSGFNRLRSLLMKDKAFESHNKFWAKCHTILNRFLVYDVIEGIIVGLANMVLMLIFGMPNVALVSVIVGVTNLLPTFGPIIGAVLGALLLVLTNPIDALIFLIFTIVLQIIDGSILKPKMFGDSFGVPAVWIFVAIVLGGKIFGVLGILLAIPVAAIFTYTLSEMILPNLEERKKGSQDKEIK